MLNFADYVAPQADQHQIKIDHVVLQPLWCFVVFFVVILVFFQVVFTIAASL